MASAVSQQADGCFVLKASEPSCGTASEPPPPDAAFDVFCNRKIPEKVRFMEGAGAAEEPEPGLPPAPPAQSVPMEEHEALKAEMEAVKAREAAFEAEKRGWDAREAALVAKIAELVGKP